MMLSAAEAPSYHRSREAAAALNIMGHRPQVFSSSKSRLYALRFWSCLLLLGIWLSPRPAHSQNWRAAYQRLPVTMKIPCGLVEADTTTGSVQALKQRVYLGVKRIIKARRGWFADEDSAGLSRYQLYRADVQPCGHELLVLYGIMDGFLLTGTPDFQVVDALQVYEWEPVGWIVSRQQYSQGPEGIAKAKGYGRELTAYVTSCTRFSTTLTARAFYHSGRKPTIISRKTTQYSISPAGKIKAVAAKK